ncbi:MAG: dTDP-4-dehydrorhamnose reductase [Bacteroidota bacterium]|nr:dTDP-4-dehydrorhamnose reductase [Bacteroidota bacterium]
MSSENIAISILVTGANGQLASEIRAIADNFPLYQFLFTSREDLPIENKEAVKLFFENHPINYCINCAAYTAVDKAESEKGKAFLINADAVGELATICKDHQTQFIHISTDYVYDGTKEIALKEEDTVAPLNVYGLSKLKGEELALDKNPSSLIIRTSWVYSSFGNNFVKTMLRLFKERDEINVVSDQMGSPTYAADLANVIMQFIERMEKGETFSGIVNYCNDGITNWYEFAEAIKHFVNGNCKINPILTSAYKTPAKRPLNSVLDTSKIKKLIQAEIPYWKDSLKKCIEKLMS